MTSITKTNESNQNLNQKQDYLIDDQNFFLEIGRNVIQHLLDIEMTEFLAAEPYERNMTRQGYRSGSRPRTLKTRIGKLHFEVPCERSGRFKTKLFAHYQRSEQAFLLALQEMYLQGVSTRRVEKITEQLCSMPISASTVSRITAKLDVELETWRKRPLIEGYPLLIIDARYENVRLNERVTNQAVLIVTGISIKGKREIIGVYIANTENETSWSLVFRDLIQRGLHGVRMVVSDDHKGIKAAIARYYQGTQWQRCQRHSMTNARDMAAKKERKALTRDLQSIFHAPSLNHARARLKEVLDQWRPGHEELVEWLEDNIEETMAYFHFPPAFRIQIRTTNMLERFNQELKRRSEVIRVFPNSESCLRLMTALAMEQTLEWACQRSYLDMRELEEWDRKAGISNAEKSTIEE
jgi:transposase-like protein